jgi:hypothetical protein
MAKVLTVATPVQKAVFEQVFLNEMSHGFWKNARPADHADYWKGVTLVVGTELGTNGFDVPRNYNFVNPEFFCKVEDKLMAVAEVAQPGITTKQLKKQLISLNQIIGGRLKEVGGTVVKLPRGRKQPTEVQISTAKKTATSSVRKALANLVEAPVAETV